MKFFVVTWNIEGMGLDGPFDTFDIAKSHADDMLDDAENAGIVELPFTALWNGRLPVAAE